MEAFIKILPVLITIIISTVGYVVWLIRMESKVSEHTCDIAELKKDQREEIKELKLKMDDVSNRILELCMTVSNLSGYLKRYNEEK